MDLHTMLPFIQRDERTSGADANAEVPEDAGLMATMRRGRNPVIEPDDDIDARGVA
jgi:hypothetical protein